MVAVSREQSIVKVKMRICCVDLTLKNHYSRGNANKFCVIQMLCLIFRIFMSLPGMALHIITSG